MKTLLGKYQNGNYITTIYSDGTKIRETEKDIFIPEFAECIDMQISKRCSNGCEFCYANCTPDGEVAELKKHKAFFDSLHPYTELAINMNFPLPNDFMWFLEYMKERNIIVNITINQNDFVRNLSYIHDLVEKNLIYGLGISWLSSYGTPFIEIINSFDNAVLHVINGLISLEDIEYLSDNGFKILILGYKDIGRGINYHKNKIKEITKNQQWLYNNLAEVAKKFDVIAFDNLALEQLNVKRLFSDNEWDLFYSGNDGQYTYYLDLVDETFAINSLANEKYKMLGTTDEMFKIVRLIQITNDTILN